jgi:hypothetical protein
MLKVTRHQCLQTPLRHFMDQSYCCALQTSPRRPGKKLRMRSTYTYKWFQRKTSKKSNCSNGGLAARLSSHGYSIWRWTYFLSQPCPARMNVFSVPQSSPYLHKGTPCTGLLWRHCNASETGLALVRFPGQNQGDIRTRCCKMIGYGIWIHFTCK